MPVFGSEISLTLPSTAVWLCVSMMPGMTNLPVASITCAPAGAVTCAFGPTAAIFPPRMRIDPCSILPCVIGEDGGVADDDDLCLRVAASPRQRENERG